MRPRLGVVVIGVDVTVYSGLSDNIIHNGDDELTHVRKT